MPSRGGVLALPFSPPEHPVLSVVEALWRPPGSTTPSSPMNASSWPKSRPMHGTPRSCSTWLKLGCSWPSLHSYIGRTAPPTDRKSQAENEDPGTSPDERKPGSRRRHGGLGRRVCRLAHEQHLGSRRVPAHRCGFPA